MTALASKAISVCSFKVISATHHVWGKQVVGMFPRALYLSCLYVRILYEAFSDRPGHLPQQLAQNSTTLFDLIQKMLKFAGTDFSISSDLCAPRVNSEPLCYPKQPVVELLTVLMHCVRQAMKNSLPEYFEEVTFLLISAVRKVVDSGVVNYFIGWIRLIGVTGQYGITIDITGASSFWWPFLFTTVLFLLLIILFNGIWTVFWKENKCCVRDILLQEVLIFVFGIELQCLRRYSLVRFSTLCHI